ncbi:MAG: lipopolysaccharide biosynthesis protein, partial [Odoribacter sp.]|nr:lipopolysaccharide biosynthesis protein [Odoribacter sp.]
MVAATGVYQFSIITVVVAILKVPYNAAIIAHEEIRFYAYMGVLEGILRLMIAISLLYFKVDKLILYGGLLAFTTSVMTGIFYLKCKRSYQECNYKYFWEKKLFKEMFAYAGISTMGNLSTVAVNQGQNILLNIFFGPVVNAARAISYQINGALSQFVTNIYTASTPQITKSYATNDRGYLVKIVNQTSLLALICLLVFLIPLLLELPSVLKLWLGDNAPPNTALFCHFILIDLLLIYVCRPLLIAIQSSG